MSRPINIDQEEMKRFVQLLRPEVAKHLQVVTRAQLGQDIVYHIAQRRQKTMFPFISKRAGESEDNTIPRVHVGPSLLSCCLGYGVIGMHAIYDIAMGSKEDKIKKVHPWESDWKGGFYIHELQFDVALRPMKKLVYDAPESDELWLVTYNELTREYPADVIGKIIVKSTEYIPRAGRPPSVITNIVAEITAPQGMRLDGRKRLSKGYWAIKVQDITVIRHAPITKEEFMAVKEVSAVMLSLDDAVPKYLEWHR